MKQIFAFALNQHPLFGLKILIWMKFLVRSKAKFVICIKVRYFERTFSVMKQNFCDIWSEIRYLKRTERNFTCYLKQNCACNLNQNEWQMNRWISVCLSHKILKTLSPKTEIVFSEITKMYLAALIILIM